MLTSSLMAPQQLRTLLCHRDVSLAIKCLRSAVLFSADPVQVVIHDDGSLTSADRDLLAEKLPGSRIFDRGIANEVMAEKLKRHPNALAFRQGSVWGLKLLDVVLAEPGLCFYIDSDICFFRPFSGLFVESATINRCVFLRDTVWHAYSIRPFHLLGRRRLTVASGINSGLTLIDYNVFDLDYVDWFLAQSDWRVIPAWTEPTCWAALALRASGHAVDPEQITNLYPSATLSDKTIGAHFLSSYRQQWRPYLEYTENNRTLAPIEIRFNPLRPLSALGLGLNLVMRKIPELRFRGFVDWV